MLPPKMSDDDSDSMMRSMMGFSSFGTQRPTGKDSLIPVFNEETCSEGMVISFVKNPNPLSFCPSDAVTRISFTLCQLFPLLNQNAGAPHYPLALAGAL